MTTANTIVQRALKTATVLEAGETAAAEDASDALDALNEMLHGWETEYGIDLGHSDLALTDTITLPDSHLRAIRYNLAIALAPEYDKPIRPDVAAIAERGLRALQGAYADVPELGFDRGLRNRIDSIHGTETFDG